MKILVEIWRKYMEVVVGLNIIANELIIVFLGQINVNIEIAISDFLRAKNQAVFCEIDNLSIKDWVTWLKYS